MCRFFLQHFHAFPSISFNYTVFVCFLVVWSDSFLHTKIPHRNSIQENVSGLRSNHEYIGFTLPNQLKDEVIGWFPLQPGAKLHRTIWVVGLIRCFFLAWRAYLEGVPQLNKHPINPTILIHFARWSPQELDMNFDRSSCMLGFPTSGFSTLEGQRASNLLKAPTKNILPHDFLNRTF